MKYFVTVTALIMVGAAVSGDAAPGAVAEDIMDSDIDISIGRLNVINQHTLEIWQKLREKDSSDGRHDLRNMNSALRSTVWEYNRLREDLCNARFAVEQSCETPFIPKWIHKKDATTLKELEARQSALEGRVVELWAAACKRLENVVSWEDSRPYCSIE
jgi:hypothetical protein